MKLRFALTVVAVGVLLVGLASVVGADLGPGEQEHPEHPTKQEKPKGTEPQSEEAMEAYMKLATPGEHHEHLGRLVGNWDYTLKMWEPGGNGEPMETAGTMESNWILGGRFVQYKYEGTFMDQPFVGVGLDGYDNGKQEYTGVWMDTMSTFIMSSAGKCDGRGKVRTMLSESVDPSSGQPMKSKWVTTVLDKNSFKSEAFLLLPSGEFKNFELLANRR